MSVIIIIIILGGLLPVLANQLKQVFTSAIILTSYGMSECMPVSTPNQQYQLEPIGTSGQAVGPSIIITDEDHNKKMSTGEVIL